MKSRIARFDASVIWSGLTPTATGVDTADVSAWRREAAASVPELWADEENRASPTALFVELLPFVRHAHRAGDDGALSRAYGFAHWCLRQGGVLANAAGVSFYEHVFDAFDLHAEVARWIHPQVAAECWSLWEYRLTDTQLREVRSHLGRH